MKNTTLSESNYELMFLIDQLSHSIYLARKRELTTYGVHVSQFLVLRIIEDLGSNATIYKISRRVKRKGEVISRQVISMEKDGLIKRVKKTPKSNLLTLELTEKGNEIIKIAGQSKAIDDIFSRISNEEHQQFESILKRFFKKR